MRMPLKVFMFGYKGWGNATAELIKAVDAVEKKRGFKPPLFVDIRIRRNVRAIGFRDDAFARLLGKNRYRWMRELGNRRVRQGRSGIKIDRPDAAADLLQLAIDCASQRRRVIFFCSCEFPCKCHRTAVAELLLAEARKRRLALQVIEWPGGEPESLSIKVPDVSVPSDRTSRLYLPKGSTLTTFAGLALGSLVTAIGPNSTRTVAVSPAMYAKKGWYLPVLQDTRGRVVPGTKREADAWRAWGGYLPRRTGFSKRP